jgi:hypothetical protein
MSRVNLEHLKSAIRDIPDFPKPGIIFKDITPILGDGQLFQRVIDHLAEEAEKVNPSKVVGIDARGFLFGAAPIVTLAVAVVWGVTVVADSAQFSTAISELAPPGTAGSALAIQTAVGFLLTGVTILGVGLLDPADGIAAMARLRGRPDAIRMANGHR